MCQKSELSLCWNVSSRQDGGEDDDFGSFLPHINEVMYSVTGRAILVKTDFRTEQ
jgi:hypothetical protein